ncbi:MAG TPA: hypothetical protein VN238_07595 [Solirubrobacteraceae bacterium]|nr:hypothetical protein [Solirubrobacteraceae bacterium]
MTWYELLLSLHILSAALWIGSSLAITVITYRLLGAGSGPGLAGFVPAAGWWASRAHPAASIVLLVTAGLMIADANLDIELWIVLALVGWLIAGGLGGSMIGPRAKELETDLAQSGGTLTDASRAIAGRLLLATRIELAILVLVVFDMVAKPG